MLCTLPLYFARNASEIDASFSIPRTNPRTKKRNNNTINSEKETKRCFPFSCQRYRAEKQPSTRSNNPTSERRQDTWADPGIRHSDHSDRSDHFPERCVPSTGACLGTRHPTNHSSCAPLRFRATLVCFSDHGSTQQRTPLQRAFPLGAVHRKEP